MYVVGRDHGVEFVGALLWFVGVGGSMLGSATVNLTWAHGLETENLLGCYYRVGGRIGTTSTAEEELDLFWAIRSVLDVRCIFRVQ